MQVAFLHMFPQINNLRQIKNSNEPPGFVTYQSKSDRRGMAWLGMLWIPVCTTLRAGLLYFVMRELQSQAFLGGSMILIAAQVCGKCMATK